MVEFITIGKILENSKSLIIYCGDYTSDDTIEFSFCIKNNKIIGIDNEFSSDIAEEIFKPNSSVLTKLSNYIKPLGIELSTNSIYNGVSLLIHKKDSFSKKWRIIDSEGGEIQNKKFQFNGMTYLRRIVEISEEIIEESICIKWI